MSVYLKSAHILSPFGLLTSTSQKVVKYISTSVINNNVINEHVHLKVDAFTHDL